MPATLTERLEQFQTAEICGLDFLVTTEAQCVELIVDAAADGVGGWVVTPNLDLVRKCTYEPDIKALCDRADVRVADGMPVVWASKLQGSALPERVTGSNLTLSVTEACAARGLKVFLLGGAPGVVERAEEALVERFSTLQIVGTYCPPFGFEKDEEEMARITEAVRASEADLVFVALSFPKGERLIEHLRPSLPNAWWIGVGISFSFVSGDVARAPAWMQKIGAEWLFRLSQEPGRLARRYLVEDVPFVLRLFSSAIRTRLSR